MKTSKILGICSLIALAFLGQSCKEDGNNNSTEPARLKFMLTDAPASYDAVNVDIARVEVRINEGDEEHWHELDEIIPGVYNLLDFRNGIDTAFAEGEVPPGAISEIRLILGTDNTVVVKGVSHSLKTPSAQQSGLKLKISDQLDPGILYEYWLDFDAERSVVELGNGGYNLKPVIRVFTKATTGSIEGFADPIDANPVIYAYNTSGDTASSRPDTVSGYFLIYGLVPGLYDLDFMATKPYLDTNISTVAVSIGSVTELDTITFRQ